MKEEGEPCAVFDILEPVQRRFEFEFANLTFMRSFDCSCSYDAPPPHKPQTNTHGMRSHNNESSKSLINYREFRNIHPKKSDFSRISFVRASSDLLLLLPFLSPRVLNEFFAVSGEKLYRSSARSSNNFQRQGHFSFYAINRWSFLIVRPRNYERVKIAAVRFIFNISVCDFLLSIISMCKFEQQKGKKKHSAVEHGSLAEP